MGPERRNLTAGSRNALDGDRAQTSYLLQRVQEPEAEASARPIHQCIGRVLGRLRQTGDRLTRGGVRALAKRAMTVLAAVGGSDQALERLVPRAREEERTYRHWVARNDTISDADREAIHAHIGCLPSVPLISVIMSVDMDSAPAFRRSVRSVSTQLYQHWELCISINDRSELLWGKYPITQDPRIKLTKTDEVIGGAAAVNAALSLATGEFVTFMRTGDTLAEHALYEVAVELSENPDTDIVYTDSDEIGADDQRSNPWFKPGWDPDLLLAQDYIGDLAVYRRALVEKIGLLRSEFEGAEFYDLTLRTTAAAGRDRVRHLPGILYHRYREDNTTASEDALSALRDIHVSRQAVRRHLEARGDTQALVEPAVQIPSANRIVWPLPKDRPLVSIIVPTRDRAELLAQSVDGILHRTDYCNLELLIVDNNSIEPATFSLFNRLVNEDSRVHIMRLLSPFNYSALINLGARQARGEVLLLLNNDIDVIGSGWLREMVSHAVRPDVGIVGAKLLYPSGQIQHGGMVLGPGGTATHVHRLASRNDPGYFGQLALTRTLSAVTGACMAIRRKVFFDVGGLDEVNLAVAYNDVDLCLRVQDHGYRVVWTPFAELFHLECASRGLDDTAAKRELYGRELQYMRKTWGPLVESEDPFHNPNLLFAADRVEIPSTPRRDKPWHQFAEHCST
jgi:O-antigen biosynthesis protein